MSDSEQMTADDRKDLETILRTYRRRLGHINNQKARLGSYCPANLMMEAEDVERAIFNLEEQLGVVHPDVVFDALPPLDTRLSRLQKNVQWQRIKRYQLFGCTVWTVVETVTVILLMVGMAALVEVSPINGPSTATPQIAHPTLLPTPAIPTPTPLAPTPLGP